MAIDVWIKAEIQPAYFDQNQTLKSRVFLWLSNFAGIIAGQITILDANKREKDFLIKRAC